MRTLVNTILVVCLSLQGFVAAIPNNQPLSNNLILNQSPNEFPSSESVPLLSTVLANQAADKDEKTTISIKANPQLILPGVPISIEWTVNGWDNISKNSDLNAVVQFPTDIKTN